MNPPTAFLRVFGALPLILLCLAAAVAPHGFWTSLGGLRAVIGNERFGGPFLPAALAVLSAYAPWSRFRFLRAAGCLANVSAGLALLLLCAMMTFVTAAGGPDARPESMPPAQMPLLFLVLAVLALAAAAASVVAAILDSRQRSESTAGLTWGEMSVLAALLCLAIGGSVRRADSESRQEELSREAEAGERSERAKAEREARARAEADGPP